MHSAIQFKMINSKTRKSQTLLYVGFALLAIIVLAALVMTAVVTNLKTASYQQKGGNAHQYAMAGIERAKAGLTNDWDNWTMDIGDDNDPHRGEVNLDETESLGQGQYWVRVEDIDPNRARVISHGWIKDAHKVILTNNNTITN